MLTVYLRAADVNANLLGKAREALGTPSSSGTIREALLFVVRDWERQGPTVEDRLTNLESWTRKQDEANAKIQRSLGAIQFGGRNRPSGGGR